MDDAIKNPDDGPWDPEVIPGENLVFVRVHPNDCRNGEFIVASILKNEGKGMSCNWDRYSDEAQTIAEGTGLLQEGQSYRALRLKVESVRELGVESAEQHVEHTPIWLSNNASKNNRAHSDILGPKSSRDGIP